VGRDAELRQLHNLFAKALRGERQIVFVTGEAGIGKTTLVDAFLSEVRDPASGVRSPRSPCPNPQAEAEACFLQAIAIARQQQAKLWELRATMSLCRLWQEQGQSTKARKLLAEIYGWFTEGFETADLQAAAALLDELGGS
jgi:Cdc6-like AAA superfamily ATPase